MKSDNDTNVATENLITEARELCERATDGPWNWTRDDKELLTLGKSGEEQEFHVLSAWRCKSCQTNGSNCLWPGKHDAEFIARSRTLIPELCDALEKAQVKHGRWEQRNEFDEDENVYICSSCDEQWVIIDGTPSDNNMHYCPNCGAKMDGEVRASIHEAQERDKGCDYCNLIYKLDGASYGTTDEIIDNKFCPMCGKRVQTEGELHE